MYAYPLNEYKIVILISLSLDELGIDIYHDNAFSRNIHIEVATHSKLFFKQRHNYRLI